MSWSWLSKLPPWWPLQRFFPLPFPSLLYCIYSPLPPFPQTTKLFICPHKVLAIVLWDIQMLFCHLQTCSSAFFLLLLCFFWTMFAPCTFLVYIVLYFVDLSKEMLESSLPTRDFLPIREVLNWDLVILFFLTWLSIQHCAFCKTPTPRESSNSSELHPFIKHLSSHRLNIKSFRDAFVTLSCSPFIIILVQM